MQWRDRGREIANERDCRKEKERERKEREREREREREKEMTGEKDRYFQTVRRLECR